MNPQRPVILPKIQKHVGTAEARLIAAAPELLAALVKLLPVAAAAYDAMANDLDEARAAIAKATGGAA